MRVGASARRKLMRLQSRHTASQSRTKTLAIDASRMDYADAARSKRFGSAARL